MISPRPPTLIGRLVTLRALDPTRDANDYHEMCLEPEMHAWTGNDVLPSVAAARDELARLAALPGVTTWAVAENSTGRMIGRFFFCVTERDGRRVIGEGNRIAKPFWRKGHNRDARRLVFAYVFNVLGADAIESACWRGNVNSRMSLLAHGFTVTGTVVEFNPQQGRPMEKITFRLTRQEWLEHAPQPGSRSNDAVLADR